MCETSGWYPGLPLAVTEHGWYSDDPGIHDERRQRYVLASLRHLMPAVEKGLRLTAYQYWALLDCYEWEQGFRPRFGIYAVDFNAENRTRTPRDFAAVYAAVAGRHAQQQRGARVSVGAAGRVMHLHVTMPQI